MNRKISKSVFTSMIIILSIFSFFVLWLTADSAKKQVDQTIDRELQFLKKGYDAYSNAFFSAMKIDDYRITWIGSNGDVLYDNQKPIDTLDNHENREEIKEAKQFGIGESVRFSDTLLQKTRYTAIQLEDGSYLRIAYVYSSIVKLFLMIFFPYLIVVAFILIISIWFGHYICDRVIKPLNHLDLNDFSCADTFPELQPLYDKIKEQKTEIHTQMTALNDQRRQFHMVTEYMQEGLLFFDEQANIIFSNSQSEMLMEQSDLLHDPEFQQLIERGLKGISYPLEMQFQGQWFRFLPSVVKDEDVIGLAIFILDITEQRCREELRKEFSANVSHELKTPLTSISGYAEIIQAKIAKEEDMVRFAGKIYDEAQHLLRLINDIIQLSALDEIKQQEKTEVDIKEMVDQIVMRLHMKAEKNEIMIVNEIPENQTLHVISSVFYEILFNVIDNAIKYNKQKGTVRCILEKEQNQWMIKVSDTGIGIPLHQQPRVFERFYRGDESRSNHIEGTGLGLSIVKNGMKKLQGEIKIESQLDKGTTIILSFPMDKA